LQNKGTSYKEESFVEEGTRAEVVYI